MREFHAGLHEGWTNGRTILSRPKFLGCLRDNQIFLPMVLRCARESANLAESHWKVAPVVRRFGYLSILEVLVVTWQTHPTARLSVLQSNHCPMTYPEVSGSLRSAFNFNNNVIVNGHFLTRVSVNQYHINVSAFRAIFFLKIFYFISVEFLSLMRRRSSWRNVPSGEEREGTAVFAGYFTFLFHLIAGSSKLILSWLLRKANSLGSSNHRSWKAVLFKIEVLISMKASVSETKRFWSSGNTLGLSQVLPLRYVP